jgi:hypothetical protein
MRDAFKWILFAIFVLIVAGALLGYSLTRP